MALPERLAARLAELPDHRHLLIAFSGGLDSSVLLHALRRIRPESPLLAIHVHHGLHDRADAMADFCAATAARLDIPFVLAEVAVERAGQGIEAAARDARYQALRERMRGDDILLTAQHADDQAETLLLQLLRGAGPKGLAAMPRLKRFEPGWLARPLLELRRDELRAWALAEGVDWREDPSNRDTVIDRNYLRHEVMPRLRARWPGVATTLSRSAALCAEHEQALAALLDRHPASPGNEEPLSLAALRDCIESEQRLILRDWLRRQGLRPPAQRHLHAALEMLLNAAPDRQPEIRLGDGRMLRRYRDALYVSPLACEDKPPTMPIPWRGDDSLRLPDGGILESRISATGAGIDMAYWRGMRRSIRYRQGGERLTPVGACHGLSLKAFYQQRAIPPWQRAWIPLLYLDEQLAAVGDLCIAAPFAARTGPAITLHWSATEPSDA